MSSVAPVGDEHVTGSSKCDDLACYLLKRLLVIILYRGKHTAYYVLFQQAFQVGRAGRDTSRQHCTSQTCKISYLRWNPTTCCHLLCLTKLPYNVCSPSVPQQLTLATYRHVLQHLTFGRRCTKHEHF